MIDFLYEYPVVKMTVEYVTSSSDYVEDSDKGTLHTLEVVARNKSEYKSFFREIESLMRKQCDCPAGADDFHVRLNPVYRMTLYRSEEEFTKNLPRTYRFEKFNDKFFEWVRNLDDSSK